MWEIWGCSQFPQTGPSLSLEPCLPIFPDSFLKAFPHSIFCLFHITKFLPSHHQPFNHLISSSASGESLYSNHRSHGTCFAPSSINSWNTQSSRRKLWFLPTPSFPAAPRRKCWCAGKSCVSQVCCGDLWMLVQRLHALHWRAQSPAWCVTALLVTTACRSPAFWWYYLRVLHLITKCMPSCREMVYNVLNSMTYVHRQTSPESSHRSLLLDEPLLPFW